MSLPEDGTAPFLTTSKVLQRLPGLSELLQAPVLPGHALNKLNSCSGVLAWGRKPSASKAKAFADRHHLPLIRLEDGFLRSVALGNQEPPLSIVVDDLGIYYDAATASRLEMQASQTLTPCERERAQVLIKAWRLARVSKYNHLREYVGELPENYVLLADQVKGDASIAYGLADQTSFGLMLATAKRENPGCTLLVKTHPDIMSGRKTGHFDYQKLANDPDVLVLAANVHPVRLLEHATAVYCVTSQLGFEGLLWNKPVRTFGMPFYAGWGLSEDQLSAPERRCPVALENLVHAALITYPRYLDPETQQPCPPERLIEWLGLQRAMRERFPAQIDALGFSLYKKPIVRRFFQGSKVFFNRKPEQRPAQAIQTVWGRANPKQAVGGIATIHLEDGFLRSVGLGVDLIHPLSWTMDSRGIYFDASCVSDLELILQTTEFDHALLERARRLRERLVAAGLTKYNVGDACWQRPALSTGDQKPVILVPGQVEADASIRYGAPGINKNLALLAAVRAANPHAYLIYKPHPDVLAGLRRQGQNEQDAHRFCDETVIEVAMHNLLGAVDEVHTMTSLTGFEALLRGKKVLCYGQPFYAGWGLTEDILPVPRRTRKLSLDELVAGVLILYPTYLSRVTGKFTTPERVLDELSAWRDNDNVLPGWRKALRSLLKVEMQIKHRLNHSK